MVLLDNTIGSSLPPEQVPLSDEVLADKFKFDLDGLELIDPEDPKGYVEDVRQLPRVTLEGDEVPRNVNIHEIRVVDRYVEADPNVKALVDSHIAIMEQTVRDDGFDPLEERRKEHPYMGARSEDGANNRYTEAWLSNDDSLRAWHSWIPTAMALGYLTNPCLDDVILNRKTGETHQRTPEFIAQARFVKDSIAMRGRAVALEHIAVEHVSEVDDSSRSWLELASGTAEPALLAIDGVKQATGVDIPLDVVDWDKKALAYVEANAERIGFNGDLGIYRQNILHPDFAERFMAMTGRDDGYALVSDSGFREYLWQDGDKIGAFKDMGLPQASEFARTAWDLTNKDIGAQISGNMIIPRPQEDFVFGLVDWSIINARPEGGILNIYNGAGILDDPRNRIDMYRVVDHHSGDHIYNLTKLTRQ